MKLKKTYRIEPDALKAAFRLANTTAAEAARKIGYSPTYFSQCYSRGWISGVAIKALNAGTGIAPETYVIDNMDESVEPVDYDRIYDLVLRATRTAIKEALS